mgnify:CR=1 FL=1
MKAVVIILLSLLSIGIANARVCSLNQTANVKEAINSKPIGQVRANTPVNIIGYDTDNNGRLLAYIAWQGQPLTAIKRQGLQNQGWVNKDMVSCANQ